MSEQAATLIFIALLVGQLIALFKGRQAAVKYYFFAAPLGYFSVWFFLTWDLARACGLILIVGGFSIWRGLKGGPRFVNSPIFLLLLYVIMTTLVGSLFWPYDAMASDSDAYRYLRGPIQIINWTIMLGVAWNIAIILTRKGLFDNIRNTVINFGIFHSVYAIYQTIAYYFDLPLTGLRRVASGVTLDSGGEQLGLNNFGDLLIYRATSLVGEPKSFGAISLIWITLVLTLYLENRNEKKHAWILALSLVALGLTYSTSAWAGAIIAFLLYIRFVGFKAGKMFTSGIILAIGFIVVVSSGLLSVSGADVLDIVSERSTGRWQAVASEGLSDLPEIEAIKVLTAHPMMALFGTGLGGMSFYIAESLGGWQSDILFPNTGALAFLCDIGIFGIALLFLCFKVGLGRTLSLSGSHPVQVKSLSYIGTALLAQCFVFGGGLLPFALAFLLASEFLEKQDRLNQFI